MFGAVDTFVRQCGVETFCVADALDGRHLDVVGFLRVVGSATAIADVSLCSVQESVGVIDSAGRQRCFHDSRNAHRSQGKSHGKFHGLSHAPLPATDP